MTPSTTLPANSAASRFSRVLPVAEIFSVERAEHLGTETIVTIVVGDAEHTPRNHGLRAPLRRWAEIYALLTADPVEGQRFMQLVFEAQGNPTRPATCRTHAPAVVVLAADAPAVPAEVPPRDDPGSPFYRAPVEKPSGGLL